MRLDYFLKVSRIVKRRSLAKEMCDKKLVRVNDQIAKAGKEIEKGDSICVTFREQTLKVEVEEVPERGVSKKEASTLYSVVEDIRKTEDELLW